MPTCTYVYAAVEQVAARADRLRGHRHQIHRPGRHRPRASRRSSAPPAPTCDFDVASNPEFLREGNAIGDFMRPDRVVIGTETDRAREVLRQLYRPLNLIEAPIVFTGIETAELTKYAGNAFLAMKVTFINEMADLCEKVGADVHDVARGIGLDGRIGRKFLHPGPGYGGSCFPKDTLALVRTAQDYGAPSRLVEATVAVNDARKSSMAMRVIDACGGSVRGKTIAVLGLTFKPETDDMRDSPALRSCRGWPATAPRSAPSTPRDGAGAAAAARMRDLLPRCVRRGPGCRCAGPDHRMERIPRAEPGAAARHDARAHAGRPAQRLGSCRDAPGWFRLPLRRPPRLAARCQPTPG